MWPLRLPLPRSPVSSGAGGGRRGDTYISPECGRQCREVKGRALKIHTAYSKGSLAQELCSLTYIRRSPSAAAACPACLQLPPFPTDPTGGCHICSLLPTAWRGDVGAELCLPRACWGGQEAARTGRGRQGGYGAGTGRRCPEALWLFPSCPPSTRVVPGVSLLWPAAHGGRKLAAECVGG